MDKHSIEERPLPDHYPVYYGYWYLFDGAPKRSDMSGTVARLKQLTGAKEVCDCDVVERGLIGATDD